MDPVFKFHLVNTLSYENGRAVQTQSNEIENVDCTVTNIRGAPVRLLLRFGVTVDEARAALQAFGPMLADLLDKGGESSRVYIA